MKKLDFWIHSLNHKIKTMYPGGSISKPKKVKTGDEFQLTFNDTNETYRFKVEQKKTNRIKK